MNTPTTNPATEATNMPELHHAISQIRTDVTNALAVPKNDSFSWAQGFDEACRLFLGKIDDVLANHPAPSVRGYLIVDKVTGEVDWDGTIHPSRDKAIESLCGVGSSYVPTQGDATEDRRYWGEVYIICAVLEAKATP
jgi:hypothetical protein